MSLLSICKSVMNETGWPEPVTIAGNTDATAKQILAIANTELRMLSQQFDWPMLQVEYAFSTVALQTVYLWPEDFANLVSGGIFDASQYYKVKGSTGLQFWQMLKYGTLASLNRTRFRVVYPLGAPGIEIVPAPAGITSLIGVYTSKYYARDAGGLDKAMYEADTDVSKVPERLVELGVKWRFRRAKGLDYSAELAEYNSTAPSIFSKVQGAGDIQIGGRRVDELCGVTEGYVPDRGFGA